MEENLIFVTMVADGLSLMLIALITKLQKKTDY